MIRPPWPDEMPRIVAAFPQFRFDQLQLPLVLVSDGADERILAIATLRPSPTHSATRALPCGMLAAFSPGAFTTALDRADALIARIVQLARDHHATTLVFNEPIKDEDPRRELLQRAGFTPLRVDELWEVDIHAMRNRIERLHASLAGSERLKRFTAASMAEADLPEVRQLIDTTGLIPPERVVLAGTNRREGYDPDCSTLVRVDGQLVGVVLAKVSGRLVTVEARVVAEAWRGGLNLVNHLLFHHGVNIGFYRKGIERVVFTANPTIEKETVQMAKRLNGRLIAHTQRWALVLN